MHTWKRYLSLYPLLFFRIRFVSNLLLLLLPSIDTLFPLYSNFSRRQDRSRLSYSFDYRRVYVPSLLLFIDKEFRRFDEGRFISELYPSSSPTESLLFLPPARIKASWLGNFCAHIRTETPRGGTDGQSSKGGEEGKGRRNE